MTASAHLSRYMSPNWLTAIRRMQACHDNILKLLEKAVRCESERLPRAREVVPGVSYGSVGIPRASLVNFRILTSWKAISWPKMTSKTWVSRRTRYQSQRRLGKAPKANCTGNRTKHYRLLTQYRHSSLTLTTQLRSVFSCATYQRETNNGTPEGRRCQTNSS
jgi:hypothetical protein